MTEVFKAIEKKILPALMVAMIECQGGKAFADELTIPHPQVEGQEKQSVYEVFGDAFRLFEQAIDETTDEELKAAGILHEGDSPTVIRMALKKVLPLLWLGYGKEVWGMLEETYAVANYDILTNGGKFFFKIERQENMKRFDKNDYERLIDDIMYRIWELTGIPIEKVSNESDANCVITLYLSVAPSPFATGRSPLNSFKNDKQATIFLPVWPIREASGFEVEASDLEKFVRAHDLVEGAVHEFLHVLGLRDWARSGDLMDPYPAATELKPVDDPGKYYASDLTYVKRLGQYYTAVSSRNIENSPSLKLVRWLRWQAMKGTLKELLEKAEKLAVKRPHQFNK